MKILTKGAKDTCILLLGADEKGVHCLASVPKVYLFITCMIFSTHDH